jgi:hypothetical protein
MDEEYLNTKECGNYELKPAIVGSETKKSN